MVYDGKNHVKLATLPGMWDRTITIGSAGKSFSVTGYKIGWMIGPHKYIDALSIVHQNTAFCVAAALQEGIAIALVRKLYRVYLFVRTTQ